MWSVRCLAFIAGFCSCIFSRDCFVLQLMVLPGARFATRLDDLVGNAKASVGRVHPFARTRLHTRSVIRLLYASATELAEIYDISIATARKSKTHDDAQDRSHSTHDLGCIFSCAQYPVVLELRRLCVLPLDV